MALNYKQAWDQVTSKGLKAQDYGWNGKFTNYTAEKLGNWNAQYLSNATGQPITTGDGSSEYPIVIAAYPYGTHDPFTGAPVPASGPTKENAIQQIRELANRYAYYWYTNNPEATLNSLNSKAKEIYKTAATFGISSEDFQKTFNDTYNKQYPKYVASAKDQYGDRTGLLGFLDKVTPIAANLGAAVITGGLSLPQQIAINAVVGVAQGKSAQDIVRSIVGAVAASEVGDVLKDVNAQIAAAGPNAIKPEVSAALINAERQAVNALVTKQDIGAAALAGAGGGAVASATSLATDSKAIQRAAGEYAQARLAGKTQFEALAISLSSFANQQEKDAAQQKVLDEAAKNPDIAKLEGNQVGALTGDQAGGTTGDPTNSLPPVTVTADQELPVQESVGSYTGTEQSELSLQNKALQTDTKSQPKTSKTNNAILLSLINKPLSRSVPIGSPTQTSSTVGSQALGQALRVGDAGAPVFGGDKDKSKRSGWNTESLRYMGNSGDSNG